MLSPPLDMKEKWFAPHLAYSMAKYGMSLVRARPCRRAARQASPSMRCGRAPPSPPAAIKNLLGGDAMMRASRTPEIIADAAHAHLP